MKMAKTNGYKNNTIGAKTQEIEMYGGICPECSAEVFISAHSAIVTCPGCDTTFAIEIPWETSRIIRTGAGIKTPRGLPTL